MNLRPGISNSVFAGTTLVLLILAGVGFSLYLTTPHAPSTTTENMTETTTATMTEGMTSTEVVTSTVVSTSTAGAPEAIQFAPVPGQMVHDAWLLVEPTGSGEYAISVYAEGLESTQGSGNVYIVEATESSGMMSTIPLGPNATASEFETTSGGVGSYFVQLMQDPHSAFESVQIVFLQGMQMSNSTVVAVADLAMM